MKYTVVGLFSGVGGIELGFEQTGKFECIYSNEFDAKAMETLRLNFDHKTVLKDITDMGANEFPKSDILVGGFPCQAFSIAGHRKGFEDERGNLFFDLMKAVELNEPRVVFLENVKNLVSHDNGNTFRVIMDKLKESGYTVREKVMNAKDYGNIPQNRERIYIVAFKNKSDAANFEFPSTIPLTVNIKSIIQTENIDKTLYYSKNNCKFYETLKTEIVKEDTVYQWRRVYVRENKSNVFPTLTANMGTGGHNVPLILQDGKIRKLSPKECFMVQGYPDSFKLPEVAKSHLYKQAGNSVVVPVIRRIADCIYEALEAKDQ